MALVAPAAASANADIVVTNLQDATGPVPDGSLRAAINKANTDAGPDRIVFQSGLTGTISLAASMPNITSGLDIVGPGQDKLVVDGSTVPTSFVIGFRAQDSAQPVSISDLSMKDNSGGAIGAVNSPLTVSNVTFSGDKYGVGGSGTGPTTVSGSTFRAAHNKNSGGAIHVVGGPLSISNSTFTGNKSDYSGGAVYFKSTAADSVTIQGSTFTGNTANADNSGFRFGGGVFTQSHGGAVAIRDSVFSGNSATAGGGALITPTTGNVSISGSTFAGNVATGNQFSLGGGLAVTAMGPVSVSNSTISGNSAATTNAFYGGGGLYIGSQSAANRVVVSDSTITGNTDGSRGGGVFFYPQVTPLNPLLQNTIVAGNSAAYGPDVSQEPGNSIDVSSSLIGTTSGASINQAGSNLLNVDPRLGPLAQNGGPTPTHTLLAGSPAIDAGLSLAPTDQRGLARVYDDPAVANSANGNGADIGAYEIQAPPVTPPPNLPKCAGKTATIVATKSVTKGTGKNDVIVGRKGADKIFGLGGNDTICGLGGNDKLFGGKGKDKLIGAAGKDRLVGGPGKDKLNGGPGKDQQTQ